MRMCAIALAALCACVCGGAGATKPNIVFIFADDLGWADLGCYGNEYNETPNLDRLAGEGMRFSNAYAASPVCSPTRASVMTGKYPARIGITVWIPGNYRPYMRMECAVTKQEMDLEETTLAEALRAGGYRTAFVGKWHLGAEPYYPQYQGFEVNIAGNYKGHPHDGYFSPYNLENLTDGPKGEYLTDRLTTEAVAQIERLAPEDAPYFLCLWHYTVHGPFDPRPEKFEKFRVKGRDENSAKYAAMIESLDESVGAIMSAIDVSGEANNTLLVFSSDNGARLRAAENWPLRGYKSELYEGGVRVPQIVRWKGQVVPNSVCDAPVISNDLYPTFLEAAGLPLRPAQHVDAVSFLSVLSGDPSFERGPLYWHYPHYPSFARGEPCSAIREGAYKLIYFYDGDRTELYDLGADPGEQRNLARLMPDLATDMRQRLRAEMEAQGAKIPTRNPRPEIPNDE